MKFRKLFVLSIAVLFLMTGVALAGGASVADNGGLAGGTYKAPGMFFGIGAADGNLDPGFALSGPALDLGNTSIAIGISGMSVDSYAWTLSDPLSRELDKATAFGTAWQSSGAQAQEGSNWATGSQIGGASYNVEAYNPMVAYANGEACAIGGTIAVASQGWFGPNTKYGSAFAATGNISGAQTDGGFLNASNVESFGSGIVQHQSYVEAAGPAGSAQALTTGSATYTYKDSNSEIGEVCNSTNEIVGGGYAATGGLSTVTKLPNGGINAHATSFAKASGGGSVITNGAVLVQRNMP